MKIYKVINNNMVSIKNSNGQEVMLKGLSIGFNKRPNDLVDQEKIEQKFVLESESTARRFQEMIVDVDNDVIEVCMSIIAKLKEESELSLSDTIYITIIDHIVNLIDRLKLGIFFDNSILWDIKRIYPVEYQLGLNVINELNKKLNYQFESNEAYFIALHIVNSELSNNMQETYQLTRVINDICDIVASDLQTTFSEDDYYYNRFIIHLRYMLEKRNVQFNEENEADVQLLETLSAQHPQAEKTVDKISQYIHLITKNKLGKEQKLYLIIHLAQMMKNIDFEKEHERS